MRNQIVMPLAVGMVLAMAVSGGCRGASGSEQIERDSTFTNITQPEWSRRAVIYEVNIRQYTKAGTVAAFADELPRLKDLGADVLLFMPVHPVSELNRRGTLGSCSAVADYTGFNPEFGTIEDFKSVVGKAHRLGMKVMIDWVSDRTGCDNLWVTDHADWYLRDTITGSPVSAPDGDTYLLDYGNSAMREAMIAAMRYWVTTADVDGFRCYAAASVPADFWNEARKQLQADKSYLFMIADTSSAALQKDAFNMGCNADMNDLFRDIAATSKQYFFKYAGEDTIRKYPVHHATAIDSLLARQRDIYPTDSYMMQMTSNDVLNSCEGTECDRLGILYRSFAVLSYTLPGVPMIYTGQETGFTHALSATDKDLPPQWTPRVDAYFSFYQTLNTLKHNHPSLRAGVYGGEMVRYPTENPDIYAFSRTSGGHTVWVFANVGFGDTYVKYTDKAPELSKSAVNLFSGKQEPLPEYMSPGAVFVYFD